MMNKKNIKKTIFGGLIALLLIIGVTTPPPKQIAEANKNSVITVLKTEPPIVNP
jgi:hypothetical protein